MSARVANGAVADIVECQLCPKLCRIAPGESGECRVRVNLDGRVRAVTFGFPSALPPAALVSLAQRKRCRAIAYTYSEPIVFFEYTYENAQRARAAGISNVLVTAGHGNRGHAAATAQGRS